MIEYEGILTNCDKMNSIEEEKIPALEIIYFSALPKLKKLLAGNVI